MKLLVRMASVVLAVGLLAACQGSSNGGDGDIIRLPAEAGQVATTVNGVAVPVSLVEAVARRHGLDPSQPKQYEQALQQVTTWVLLAQQARDLGVRDQQDLRASIEAARLQGVAAAVLQAYQRSHPVTHDMVAQDYARQVGEVGNQTYRFTQLLFQDKANADQAAAALAAGRSFADVFAAWKDKAIDARPYEGVFPRQLPAPLEKVIVGLQPGQTSAPIQTKLGWHLLHLDAIDRFKAPPLAEVEDTVRRNMQQKQADAWVNALEERASIVVDKTVHSVKLPASAASSGGSAEPAQDSFIVHDQPAAPSAPARAGSVLP